MKPFSQIALPNFGVKRSWESKSIGGFGAILENGLLVFEDCEKVVKKHFVYVISLLCLRQPWWDSIFSYLKH